jgi:ferredoxin
VLEVLREAGVDVLSDCEEGICGSCETGVLEGEVEHRDFVLTAQERAANDCMMVCVSRSACPVLVLQA